MAKVFLGLVHYPIYNKRMEIVTTSITNLDLHDIARAATTYGVEQYFLIHPDPTQQQLIRDMMAYWQEGHGTVYNPDRSTAFACVALAESIADAKERIFEQTGMVPKVVVTDARVCEDAVSYQGLRQAIAQVAENYLILFGTGWGMSQEVMDQADYRLPPILGAGEYNHLSVRSAVAIILDRLLGEAWF